MERKGSPTPGVEEEKGVENAILLCQERRRRNVWMPREVFDVRRSIRIPRFALRPSNPHIVPTTFARLIGISRILISLMFITRRNHDEYFLDNRVKIRYGN